MARLGTSGSEPSARFTAGNTEPCFSGTCICLVFPTVNSGQIEVVPETVSDNADYVNDVFPRDATINCRDRQYGLNHGFPLLEEEVPLFSDTSGVFSALSARNPEETESTQETALQDADQIGAVNGLTRSSDATPFPVAASKAVNHDIPLFRKEVRIDYFFRARSLRLFVSGREPGGD